LSPEELSQRVDLPRHEPIPLLIAQLAARSPELLAVEAGGRRWTYETLAARSAEVASGLLSDGLSQGDVVAVTGRRTPELIACLLGVLASGGVLLPVDPALPERRKHLLLAEAGATRVLDADRARGAVAAPALDVLAASTAPEDPAYVLFTSGTTGVPRAVVGLHRGLSHFLAWQRGEFGVGPEDRCAQLTGLSFDVVLRDVFLPLTAGAVLCLPTSGESPAPEEIFGWLQDERITLLHAVPTVTMSWLPAVPVPSLRCVFFAGEALTGELVNDLRAAVSPAVEVVNLYGPTETTLAKSFFRVPSPAPSGPQPVGRPLPQTQIFVLDGDARLCNDDEPGEVVIRTPFRTAGYLDGTGFAPNPFNQDDADVVYRTGDRGRRSADGTLWVLGRLDDQIKIRGVRVEPAEVTAVLAAHPAVADAVVLGRAGSDGGVWLDGYAVLKKGVPATAEDLRADLHIALPAVMVPGRVSLLPRLPVTPNGKLDRAALLALDDPPAPQPDAIPRDGTLRAMAEIWSEVLDQKVEGDDDFFAIGGHSLQAASILSRVRKAFGVTLTMRTLFERPTLADFAGAAVEETGRQDDNEPPPAAFERRYMTGEPWRTPE
jgi:amino acid adenylation domain-containing protein